MAALVVSSALPFVPVARAGAVGTQVWVGPGASWPDYNEKPIACVRGGIGVLLADHFTLGASGQADREHSYYFADASVIFPPVGLLEPYARFQFGRRDHSGDDAMGGSAGVRIGEDAIRLFAEGYWIFEPEDNYGVVFGISF